MADKLTSEIYDLVYRYSLGKYLSMNSRVNMFPIMLTDAKGSDACKIYCI